MKTYLYVYFDVVHVATKNGQVDENGTNLRNLGPTALFM